MRPMEILLPAAIIIIAGILLLSFFSKTPVRKGHIITKDGDAIPLDLEIADNPASRAKGLMGRQHLAESSGMLFLFERPGRHSFWMLNTTIPLEALHLAPDGTILEIIRMEPCGLNPLSCPSHPPSSESLNVLELNAGFSDRHGISIGDRFALEP